MEKKYHGIIPPLVTPIDKEERVDEEALRRLIDYSISNGLHGLFVAGSNGESLQLTQKERTRAIKIGVDSVKKRVPFLAGVMDSSTKRVIENIKELEGLGVDGFVVTPIFYDRHTSQDEIIRHFEGILKETTGDIIIYNIPKFTGETIEPETVIKISELSERIRGYKDSGGDFEKHKIVLNAKKDDMNFSILQGSTKYMMESLLLGASGVVPAIAPAFPKEFVMAYENRGKGKDEYYQALINEIGKINKIGLNPTAIAKFVISKRIDFPTDVIMPQDTLTSYEKELILEEVKKIDSIK